MNDKWFPNGEPDPDYPVRDDDWYAQQDADEQFLARKDKEDDDEPRQSV